MTTLKEKIHRIFTEWYKGYDDDAPDEYLENKILSVFKEELLKKLPKEIPDTLGMGGPTPEQAYNLALKEVREVIEEL